MKTRLKQLRKAAGFTQQRFAQSIGLSHSHYCQIENGKAKPSLETWLRIKQALNYPNDDILCVA